MRIFLIRNFAFLFCLGLFVVVELVGAVDTAVSVEAETAALGSGFETVTEGGVTYITAKANFSGTVPSSADTVAAFSVSFPEAGDYELYARIFVGQNGADDDSLIVATSLGDVAVGESSGWSLANGLWNVGFSNSEELVLSSGESGVGVWKWIRVSSFASLGAFSVPGESLTQTFKISSREDGLRIDKIAFGQLRVTFTVNQLDEGLAGWDQRDPKDGDPFQATGPILAAGKGKFLGSVWSSSSANNKDFEFYWNGMWHGNAGKWGSVEGTRDVMNWTTVDEGYQFAKEHGVTFNFHVLLWGAQQPSWISSLPPAEQLEEIEEWMAAVAERYPDIDYLQVVNEPINAPPNGGGTRANYADALGGVGETGFDWILEGFRLARHYFPNTPLMINEYSIEGSHARSDRYLEIIEALQAEGLIDLIGFQGHAFSTKTSSSSDLRAILVKIAGTGLPIMLTEMEIDGIDDFVQLAEYKRVFPIYWDHPSVIGINISGHIGNWRYDEGAYLVNPSFSERPALKWLREYVAESDWPTFGGYLSSRGLSAGEHTRAADVDGDSLSTGFEYLLGLDPEIHDFDTTLLSRSGEMLRVSLPVSARVLQGVVEVQSSLDLVDWETVASYDLNLRKAVGLSVEEGVAGRVLRYEGRLLEPPKLFYRVRFVTP